MDIVCLDLEGVLVPEIWIAVAERTGIDELRATTRDVADYDELMRQRLDIMATHRLGLSDVRAVIDEMGPLDGAEGFLQSLRAEFQVVILSDTFYEFAEPLMRRLRWPTLFCHRLRLDGDRVAGYALRLKHHKRRAVQAFRRLNFTVLAAGDSYNDTAMLGAADAGILFRPPDAIVEAFPQFPVSRDYGALRACMDEARARLAKEITPGRRSRDRAGDAGGRLRT